MPQRFVILKHNHPFLHWDLLLEEESFARTWRLLRMPCLGEPIAAEPLAGHRLMFLDYQGPLTENRGHVERVVTGMYEVESSCDECLKLKLSETSFALFAEIQTLKDGRIFVTFSTNG